MPVTISPDYHIPPKPVADIEPDIKIGDKYGIDAAKMLAAHASISTEVPWGFSKEQWDAMTPEEREKEQMIYRCQGLRGRNDIKDRTFKINRDLCDIP